MKDEDVANLVDKALKRGYQLGFAALLSDETVEPGEDSICEDGIWADVRDVYLDGEVAKLLGEEEEPEPFSSDDLVAGASYFTRDGSVIVLSELESNPGELFSWKHMTSYKPGKPNGNYVNGDLSPFVEHPKDIICFAL